MRMQCVLVDCTACVESLQSYMYIGIMPSVESVYRRPIERQASCIEFQWGYQCRFDRRPCSDSTTPRQGHRAGLWCIACMLHTYTIYPDLRSVPFRSVACSCVLRCLFGTRCPAHPSSACGACVPGMSRTRLWPRDPLEVRPCGAKRVSLGPPASRLQGVPGHREREVVGSLRGTVMGRRAWIDGRR